ncbi:hypothetical protein NC652_006893 [Populus alba x Populus x berolinensis]|nr:hypothetical protein NC652_006893 [Populus alba x Populus x berolinensis]
MLQYTALLGWDSCVRADDGSTISGFDGMIRSGANGFAGGIWALLSNSQMVDASVHRIRSRCLTLEIADLDGQKWLSSAVYASPVSALKEKVTEAPVWTVVWFAGFLGSDRGLQRLS